jgi:hypothetical protein
MTTTTIAKLQPGYAFQSSRRRPKEPSPVIIGDGECGLAKHVGTAVIDGYHHNAFKLGRVFYFQLAIYGNSPEQE